MLFTPTLYCLGWLRIPSAKNDVVWSWRILRIVPMESMISVATSRMFGHRLRCLLWFGNSFHITSSDHLSAKSLAKSEAKNASRFKKQKKVGDACVRFFFFKEYFTDFLSLEYCKMYVREMIKYIETVFALVWKVNKNVNI